MKRILFIAALLLAPVAAHAQATSKVVSSCGGQSYTAGKPQYPTMDTTGNACGTATITGTVTTTNASVGTNGAAAKTSSTLMGVSDGTNQQQVLAPIALSPTGGVNGNNTVSVANWIWNGSAYVAQSGTTTGTNVIVNSALPAGTNAIGHVVVDGNSFQLAPTITVQNAAYSAGNSEGGLITVTGAARTNGGTGTLTNVRLKSTGGSTNTIWIYAWSKTPSSTCTDKSAYVSNTADQPFSIPGFPVQVVLGGNPGSWDTATYAQVGGMNVQFKNQDSSPGTAIYMCLVTAGSVTPATTSDLSLVTTGVQD